MVELSRDQARRIALAAQGFGVRRPGLDGGRVDRRHFRTRLDSVGAVQIDSVNVITRAHELAFFARLGPYSRPALAEWLHSSGEVFEYWGHEASFLPVALHPAVRFKMAKFKTERTFRPDYVESVREIVRERGATVPADIATEADKRRGSWWDWSAPKRALESLFFFGEVTAVRNHRFERVYDIPERVLPRAVLDAPTPTEEEQRRVLMSTAARAMGLATARDIAVYFRLRQTQSNGVIKAMVEDGELVPAKVEGWKGTAYLHRDAKRPRKLHARALLAPFDSLVWERDRVMRVFDFHYRIEIYTPQPKRVYGYYVLPFLLGDRLVGRVDVKADRKAGALLVRATWAEDGVVHDEVAPDLAAELHLMAGWLGLDRVEVTKKGNLASALRRAI